jgi:hypothetical protein
MDDVARLIFADVAIVRAIDDTNAGRLLPEAVCWRTTNQILQPDGPRTQTHDAMSGWPLHIDIGNANAHAVAVGTNVAAQDRFMIRFADFRDFSLQRLVLRPNSDQGAA